MAARRTLLVFDIWHDIKRNIISYFFLVLVVCSAFAVIYYTHLTRQTTSQLGDLLDIEWRNLQLEQNSLAEHSTIESKAKKHLQMKRPDVNSEIIIRL